MLLVPDSFSVVKVLFCIKRWLQSGHRLDGRAYIHRRNHLQYAHHNQHALSQSSMDISLNLLSLQCPAYASRIIISYEMWDQKTPRVFSWQRNKMSVPCWSPRLLGFEVQLLDLNQHGAGQGLYRLLWPTSVWCAPPLTSLSPALNHITLSLQLYKTLSSLCLWSSCWEEPGCCCINT